MWKICVPCLQAIEKAASFREMAAKSDRLIQELLQKADVTEEYDESLEVSVLESDDDAIDDDEPIEQVDDDDNETPAPEFVTITGGGNSTFREPATPKIIFRPRSSSVEHSGRQFKCLSCLKVFPTKDGLIEHSAKKHRVIRRRPKSKAIHQSLKPKVVDGVWHCCGEEFNRGEFVEHRRTQHAKTYNCLICLLKFETRSILMKHQKKFHQNEEKSTYCPICQKSFPTVNTLRSHTSRMHRESASTALAEDVDD